MHYSRWQRTGSTETVRRAANGTPLADRFWTQVEVAGPDDCWLWQAGTQEPFGHGVIWDGKRMVGAHRVSWFLHHGSVPQGKWILHTCDVPACVNPKHLYIGTSERNVRDCFERGRSPYQKLTSEDVREIRSLIGTMMVKDIAEKFGVHRQTIGDIRTGRRWGWLDDVGATIVTTSVDTSAKLTEQDVRAIRGDFTGARGEKAAFARKYGVSKPTIQAVLERKTWAWLE